MFEVGSQKPKHVKLLETLSIVFSTDDGNITTTTATKSNNATAYHRRTHC